MAVIRPPKIFSIRRPAACEFPLLAQNRGLTSRPSQAGRVADNELLRRQL